MEYDKQDDQVVTHQPLTHKDGSGLAGVVQNQPGPPRGCPPGLEYFTQVDQLIYKQTVHLVETFCPWEKNNEFIIMNNMGQQVYTAVEETSCAMRWFCGAGRGFVYSVKDNNGMEVLTVHRKFKCCAGCCWCADSNACGFEVDVKTADGEQLGFVRQKTSSWKAHLSTMDKDRSELGHFIGPCCPCNCCCCDAVEFPLYAGDDKTVIGKVSKNWSGAAREIFTDADNYSCEFPMDMDVRSKAAIFGATFLVDMMFFQK